MVERYPHTATLIKPPDIVQASNGYISAGTSTPTELEIDCRVKVSGQQMKVSGNTSGTGANGDVILSSYTISFPLITDDFTHGQVRWEGKLYNIIKHHNYQGRSKIWV